MSIRGWIARNGVLCFIGLAVEEFLNLLTKKPDLYFSVYESAIAAAGCQSFAMRLSPDGPRRYHRWVAA